MVGKKRAKESLKAISILYSSSHYILSQLHLLLVKLQNRIHTSVMLNHATHKPEAETKHMG